MPRPRQNEGFYLVFSGPPMQFRLCRKKVRTMGRAGVFLTVLAMTEEKAFEGPFDLVADLPTKARASVCHGIPFRR